MKINFRIVSLMLAGLFYLNSVSGQKNTALEITPLTENFYIYVTYQEYNGVPVSANGMYLVTNEGVVMFDSPWDSTQFQPLLNHIEANHGKKVVLCIATHSHEDRTGGIGFMNKHNIKTCTTRKTDEILQKENLPRATLLFEKDTSFHIGGYHFQAYFPGEGHTVDNIVVWFEKESILYGGCLIKSTEAVDLGYVKESNLTAWSKTIQQLKKKTGKPKFIVTGHQSWRSRNALNHTLKLLRQ